MVLIVVNFTVFTKDGYGYEQRCRMRFPVSGLIIVEYRCRYTCLYQGLLRSFLILLPTEEPDGILCEPLTIVVS